MTSMLMFNARGWLVAMILAIALLTGLSLAPATVAFAAPGPNASCMGHEASDISPPGSSSEFSGGMPELNKLIKDGFPGLPPGVIYSTVAKLHEGSHEACDAALEGGE